MVPVVRLTGAIGMSSPLRPGLSISTAAPLIERAFSMAGASAVAIVVNSPGGAAVQSHLIYKRIRALAAEKSLRVYVFIEDVGASGGYMIACAGDEIIADAASIVGSIGVVTATFGLDRLIQRFGIERRVYTAGERKATLDPFLPEREEDVQRLRNLQKDVHEAFVGLVKERRGDRLQGSDELLFSGEFWSGARGVELGLVDRIGEVRTVLRERFGEEVVLRPISRPRGLFGRRGFSLGVPAEVSPRDFTPEGVLGALSAEWHWSRFGL